MKYFKYTIVSLFLILIAVVIGLNYYRDSIARGVANRALRGQDITVTDLTVDSIQSEMVKFGELVLERENGMRIEVEGLTLPLNLRGPMQGALSIEGLNILSADESGDPAPLATLLEAFLNAPATVPLSEVNVTRVSVPGLPELTDLAWRAGDNDQYLSFNADRYAMAITIQPAADAGYRSEIALSREDGTPALSMELAIEYTDPGYLLAGAAKVNLSSWIPVLRALQILPAAVSDLQGQLYGPVRVSLPGNVSQPVLIVTDFAPLSPTVIDYQVEDGPQVLITSNTTDAVHTTLEYPSYSWTASIDRNNLQIATDGVDDLPLQLTALNCRSGIVCAMTATLHKQQLQVYDWQVDELTFSAPMTITMQDTIDVVIATQAGIAVSGIRRPDFQLAALYSEELLGASVQFDESGWHLAADNLVLMLQGLNIGPDVTSTLPLQMTNFQWSGGGNLRTNIAVDGSLASLSVGEHRLAVPSLAGVVTQTGNVVSAVIALSKSDTGISADLALTRDMATGDGNLKIDNAVLPFEFRPLSDALLEWPYTFDIVGGSLGPAANIAWTAGEEVNEYAGEISLVASGVSGNYGDTVFAGLDTELTLSTDADGRWIAQPAAINLDLVEIGVPVENLHANVLFNIAEQSAQVDDLGMEILGGTVTAENFNYAVDSTTSILLELQEIQLEFIVGLLEFSNLVMTGSVSGTVPVSMIGDTITIVGGTLQNDGGGGVIRYGSSAESLEAVDPQLGLVSRALGNFQYELLRSDVSYSEAGDLKLQTRIEGVNPDMDANQPVILNLGVENNIPQMMRSLQATRTIEDILEKRMAK